MWERYESFTWITKEYALGRERTPGRRLIWLRMASYINFVPLKYLISYILVPYQEILGKFG